MFHIYEENNHIIPIIDAIPSALYVVDETGSIAFMNRAARDLLEKENIAPDLKNFDDIIRDRDIRDEEGQAFDFRNLTFGDSQDIKGKILKFSRACKESYYSISFSPIIWGKKVQGAVLALEDVTERQLRKRQMKRDRERFIGISTELKTKCDIIEILRHREKEHLMHLKDVMNNISEGLIVLDSKGKFNFSNKALYSIIDIDPSDIVNYPNISQKYSIKRPGSDCQDMEELYKSKVPVKNQIIHILNNFTQEEKYVELNINPIYGPEQELRYTIITLKDITDIKRHEINAQEQSNFIENVVETMDIPIAVFDYPEMNIKLANKEFSKLLENITGNHLSRNQLLSRKIGDIFKGAHIKNKEVEKRMLQDFGYCSKFLKQLTCSPYEIYDEQDEKRFYKIKYKPCKDINGNVNTVNIQAMDITEETIHSMELEKINNLKDEFFTVISHELRTPLTIIYSSLQLAYDIYGKELTSNIEKTLSRIEQNCSRLLKLINNILDISKAEAGFIELNPVSFEIVSATEFIVSSVNYYARSKGIDLIFDTNEEERVVSMDKDKYEKILLNLLSNAVKFTPEGKTIMVTLEINQESVTLSVKDEGIGIPDEKINYIFDRFAQVNSSLSRRAEGTGLGLSLVKTLVELMSGTIKVLSQPDCGSEFIICFPDNYSGEEPPEDYSMVNSSVNDKINIEFSDVN